MNETLGTQVAPVVSEAERLAEAFGAIARAREARAVGTEEMSTAAFAANPEWGKLSSEEQGEIERAFSLLTHTGLVVEEGRDLIGLGVDSGYTVIRKNGSGPLYGVRDGRLFRFDGAQALKDNELGYFLLIAFGALIGTPMGLALAAGWNSPNRDNGFVGVVMMFLVGALFVLTGMWNWSASVHRRSRAEERQSVVTLGGRVTELGSENPKDFLLAWRSLRGNMQRLETITKPEGQEG